jgi:uncharacterized membrane protein YphA (DoxX/SURF4 family)
VPLRRVARSLLAATFIAQGVDLMLNPKPKADMAKPLLDKTKALVPAAATVDPGRIMQADGAVKAGAGLMMALGRAPRLSAALLAIDLIPGTVAEHPFWSNSYPDDRKAQRAQFLKNAGLLGGLLLAVTDTGGKPSLAWRARQATKHAKRSAEKNTEKVKKATRRARKHAERTLAEHKPG